MNTGLSFIQHHNYNMRPYFGHIDCAEVREECRKHQIPFESMRYFVPFVCVVWFNDKGRFALSVQHDTPTRLPAAKEWKTPPLNEMEMLDHIRHNGAIRGTNIFFRAQSGHSRIRQSQRPGVDYDFRHNILMHKTTTNNFTGIKHRDNRAVKAMGRDIHFVPVEFFYHDPQMLRQYGDRVLLFNMNRPETREAFRTAKETPNGYILVNEDVSIDHIEAVYALEKTNWEFPWEPRTKPRFCEAQGVNMAQDMCSYFSKCYVVRNPVTFDDLEQPLRDSVTQAGQHYEQNLRHTGDALRPEDISAETPAQQRKSQRDRANLIDDMVQGIDKAVKAESQRQKKIEPKLMPVTKKSPPDLPASVATEEPRRRPSHLLPCAKVQDPKPPPKHLAKSASESTDTTVKVEPKQPEAPPPPPPKRNTDTPVKTETQKAKTEETSDPTSSTTRKNKIIAESGGPSTSSASSSRPHPIPPAPPVRTPQPPDHPPPKQTKRTRLSSTRTSRSTNKSTEEAIRSWQVSTSNSTCTTCQSVE